MDAPISYPITKSISFSYPLILLILIELLIFLNIETRLPNSRIDECETHLCFEFISHAIISFYIHIYVKLIIFPLNLVL